MAHSNVRHAVQGLIDTALDAMLCVERACRQIVTTERLHMAGGREHAELRHAPW